jgi:hypothetical protein
MKVPKKPTNAWVNRIAILLGPVLLIYPFVGDEIDSPTKGVDRFVHPFSVNMAVEEVGGLNPGCEISYLRDGKLARWSTASCALALACRPSVSKK